MKITPRPLIKRKLSLVIYLLFSHVCLHSRLTILQESGIYQYETRKSVTPKGFGREIDTKIPEEFRLEPIVFQGIQGVLAQLLIGMGFSIIALLIEIIVYVWTH